MLESAHTTTIFMRGIGSPLGVGVRDAQSSLSAFSGHAYRLLPCTGRSTQMLCRAVSQGAQIRSCLQEGNATCASCLQGQ